MSANSPLISSRRDCRKARADLSSAVCSFRLQYRAFEILRSLISCFRQARRSEMWLTSIINHDHTLVAKEGLLVSC